LRLGPRIAALLPLLCLVGCPPPARVSRIALFEPAGRVAQGQYHYYPLKVAARGGWVAVLDGSPNLGFRNSRVLLFNKATGLIAGVAEIPRGADKGAKGHGLHLDDQGRIYVAVEDVGKTHILRLTPRPTGGFQQEWDRIPGATYPTGISMGPGGLLHLVDAGNHRIIRLAWKGFDPAVIGSSRELQTPRGIAVDRAGNLYTHVLRDGQVWIVKYAPDGTKLTSFAVEGVEEPLAWFYNDLVLDSSGRIYLSDYAKSRILVLAEDGKVVQTLTAPGLKGPMGLSLDEKDHLFVADAWAKQVLHFRPVYEHELERGTRAFGKDKKAK
jgi:DNA-binding beta-propeller fold protein YncE